MTGIFSRWTDGDLEAMSAHLLRLFDRAHTGDCAMSGMTYERIERLLTEATKEEARRADAVPG